jgi:hypothetical protein
MDYRIRRKFSRRMFNINLALSFFYLISLIAVYLVLNRHYTEHYYIQTNNGFMVPIKNFDPEHEKAQVIEQYFGVKISK